MKIEIDIPEHHYNNIMAIDSISLGRVPYKGIIMYAINAIKRGRVLEQEPIIDRIRAEISTVYESLDGYDPDSLGAFVSKIDEILDRYKAESEEV